MIIYNKEFYKRLSNNLEEIIYKLMNGIELDKTESTALRLLMIKVETHKKFKGIDVYETLERNFEFK